MWHRSAMSDHIVSFLLSLTLCVLRVQVNDHYNCIIVTCSEREKKKTPDQLLHVWILINQLLLHDWNQKLIKPNKTGPIHNELLASFVELKTKTKSYSVFRLVTFTFRMNLSNIKFFWFFFFFFVCRLL